MSNLVLGDLPSPFARAATERDEWLASFSLTAHNPVTLSAGKARSRQVSEGAGASSPALARNDVAAVVFDGLLYNRDELEDLVTGYVSATASDADLLLHVFLRCGEEMLAKLKGVFALLIWDGRRNVIIGARDPLGVYPLFFAETGREVLFSLSIETLARHTDVASGVDRAIVADYLLNRWPKKEETFFTGVRRVPVAHVLRVGNGICSLSRYWHPPSPRVRSRDDDEDDVKRFDELMAQAVDRCLRLGPAGIFLSGGLDSVSVAAFATDISHSKGLADPLALSLRFPHPECDEGGIQRSVATDLGLRQVMMEVDDAAGPSGQMLAGLKMSSQLSAPLQLFWLPSYIRLGVEAQRQGCRVVLTGGAGDDWLTVDPIYAANLLLRGDVFGLWRLIRSFERSYSAGIRKLIPYLGWRHGARPILHAAGKSLLSRVAPGVLRERRRRQLERWLQSTPDWVAPDPELRRDMKERLEQRMETNRQEGGSFDFYWKAVPAGDRDAMSSMEMEESFQSWRRIGLLELLPFLDIDLVRLLYWMPPEVLNRGGRSKGLVRETLARRFPRLGFERQKKIMTYDFFRSLLQREAREAWRQMGGARTLGELGLIDTRKLNPVIENVLAGRTPSYYKVWSVLNVEAWIRPRI